MCSRPVSYTHLDVYKRQELILSLVRNMKNRTFVERSFILRTVRWCWRTVKRICHWIAARCKDIWHSFGDGKDSLWQVVFSNYKTRNVVLVLSLIHI